MKWLLLPEDEAELIRYLSYDLGMVLLLSDLTRKGRPAVAKDPVKALPPELPLIPRPLEPRGVYLYLLWSPQEGPIRTLGEAPEPSDPVARVSLQLTKDSAADAWRDVIYRERTPLIIYKRCMRHDNGDLVPAGLGGSVRRLNARATRWLQRAGERINPFDYCDEPGFRRPKDLRGWWVWARPHALHWLRSGGRLWLRFGY